MPNPPSLFDPTAQHDNVPAKLVASLDRLSHALRSLLWEEAKATGLSPIQIQLLVHLRHHDWEQTRVGDLARQFDLTAATISEALTSLVEKKLVAKEPDPADKRARVLCLTKGGRELASRVGAWAELLERQVRQRPDHEAVIVMQFLMSLISGLQDAGVVTVARMCTTCRFFESAGRPGSTEPHYCTLLDKPLSAESLRFDCPEHQAATPSRN